MTRTSALVSFILASGSVARANVLRQAGIDPMIAVPDVDEAAILADLNANGQASPTDQVQALAKAKAEASLEALPLSATGREFVSSGRPGILVACDSMLEFEGQMQGKPHDPAIAKERIGKMQGHKATLWTGHTMIYLDPSTWRVDSYSRPLAKHSRRVNGTASTTIHFGHMSEAEIDAYVATNEPLEVAGSFTIDGLGGPFITGVDGDPHSVIGISLPLLRKLADELDVFWPNLWSRSSRG